MSLHSDKDEKEVEETLEANDSEREKAKDEGFEIVDKTKDDEDVEGADIEVSETAEAMLEPEEEKYEPVDEMVEPEEEMVEPVEDEEQKDIEESEVKEEVEPPVEEAVEEAVEEFTEEDEDTQEIRRVFELLDTNGNGSLSPSELANALRAMGCNPLDSEIDEIIADADSKTNPNGQLEFDEFKEMVIKHRKSREIEMMELMEAFKRFDKNGNGIIDKEELRVALTSIGASKLSDEEVEELFQAIDADSSGGIDYAELVQALVG